MPEQPRGQGGTRGRATGSLPAAAKQTAAKASERRTVERRVADPALKPAVERRVAKRRTVDRATMPDVKPAAKRAVAEPEAWPAKERRVTNKSLLERRLADPTAKERRKATPTAKKSPVVEPVKKRAALPVAAKVKVDEPAKQEWSEPVEPRPTPNVQRGAPVEDEMRDVSSAIGPRNSPWWASKSAAVLVGLNVLTVIVVILLWHVHSVQLKEMRKATAASGEAAYTACLGSQTLRNELLQLRSRTSLPAQRGPVMSDTVQRSPGTRENSAQVLLDVDKTASVGAHVPVLFHLGVQNIGKSSALNAKVWGVVKIVDGGKEPDFKYGEASFTKGAISAGDASEVVLYTANNGNVAPLTDAELERINSGAAYVVAYGRAVYEDIFGAKHWAEFCHRVTEPVGGQSKSGRCIAYNSSGVSEPVERAARTVVVAPSGQSGQTVAMDVPEIACQIPTEVKN